MYWTDGNKNVLKLFDATGVLASYSYDPFGKVTVSEGLLATDNPFRFSSEYHNDITGLVEYIYRKYDPVIGRWINRDPLEEQGGNNLYTMLSNNSISLIDNVGLYGWERTFEGYRNDAIRAQAMNNLKKVDIPKPAEQCIRNGETIFLFFDGKTLANSHFSVPAVSGMYKSIQYHVKKFQSYAFNTVITTEIVKKFNYSKEYQKIKNKGPIPEGEYWFHVGYVRSARTSFLSHIVKHKGWGNYSWSLQSEFLTNSYDRGGFFIHGGTEWGSAGCIDIKNGDKKLFKYLDGLCNCYVLVKVKYLHSEIETTEEYTTAHTFPWSL